MLGMGALCRRNNVFLYHETLLKRNVAFETLTYDLVRKGGRPHSGEKEREREREEREERERERVMASTQ